MSGFTSRQGKTRSRGVPSNIRAKVLRRDQRRCQIGGPDCTFKATEVDHVIPWHLCQSDDVSNLQAVCSPCHATKTQAEAQAARAEFSRKRPPEPHPSHAARNPRRLDRFAEILAGEM